MRRTSAAGAWGSVVDSKREQERFENREEKENQRKQKKAAQRGEGAERGFFEPPQARRRHSRPRLGAGVRTERAQIARKARGCPSPRMEERDIFHSKGGRQNDAFMILPSPGGRSSAAVLKGGAEVG